MYAVLAGPNYHPSATVLNNPQKENMFYILTSVGLLYWIHHHGKRLYNTGLCNKYHPPIFLSHCFLQNLKIRNLAWMLHLLCVAGCLCLYLGLRLAVCWLPCDMHNQTNKQSMSNRAHLWNYAWVFFFSCINNGWINEMWQAGMDFVHEGDGGT